jgi:signal peptidase I
MTSHRSSPLRWLGALLALAAVGALWVEFAPSRIGGSADYAVIDGISMNPKLHAGDLVLMRPASNYQVGDVVGYHNLQLGRLVLHRIVGRDGDTYVFKGDNNSFLDAYHPTANQLVGKLWFHVPKVGAVFTWLHKPNHSAIAVGILVLLLLGGGGARAVRHNRRHGRRSARTGKRKQRQAQTPGIVTVVTTSAPNPALGRMLLTSALSVALLFGLICVIGFSHSTTSTTQAPGAYNQDGVYSYSGRVSPSPLYPSGRVSTGQTVFTRLAQQITTRFAYQFVSALPHSVSGTASLQETLQSSTGWTKTLPSPPTAHFQGDRVQLVGALNLTSLEQQMQQYAKLTGIANDSFTVALTPTVNVVGNIGGSPITTDFAPTPITFALDAFSLRLQDATTPLTPGESGTPTDALHPSAPGVLPQTAPASVKLLVTHIGVTTARRAGLIGLVVAAVLALAGLLVLGRGGSDELASIRRRGGDLLVPVSSPPVRPAGGYVDVANFDSLDHLARSYELVILHHQRGAEHSFYIDDDGSIYRYRVRTGADGVQEQAQA